MLKKVGNVPHVVHLRDSFETKRHLYFVMELCQGAQRPVGGCTWWQRLTASYRWVGALWCAWARW